MTASEVRSQVKHNPVGPFSSRVSWAWSSAPEPTCSKQQSTNEPGTGTPFHNTVILSASACLMCSIDPLVCDYVLRVCLFADYNLSWPYLSMYSCTGCLRAVCSLYSSCALIGGFTLGIAAPAVEVCLPKHISKKPLARSLVTLRSVHAELQLNWVKSWLKFGNIS